MITSVPLVNAGGTKRNSGGVNVLTFALPPVFGIPIWGGVYAVTRGLWNIGYGNCGVRGYPECPAGTGFGILSIFIVGIAVIAYFLCSVNASSRGGLIHLLALPIGALAAWARVTVTGVAHYQGDVNVIFMMACLTDTAYLFGYLFLMKVIIDAPGKRFASLRRFRSRGREYELPRNPAEFRIFFGVLLVDLPSIPAGLWLFSQPFS
ncbi:hypothetical protein RKD28_002983 [Streptomyces sp. SAI-229]